MDREILCFVERHIEQDMTDADPEEARQSQQTASHHHVRVDQPIGANHVLEKGDKSVHILARCYSGAFALVFAPKLSLLGYSCV